MKTKDIITILSVALGTATLTVLTCWSPSIEAGNEGEVPAARIVKPKLAAHGIEMTLASAQGRIFKAGDQPAFELTAVNTTDEPANFAVRVAMTTSSPSDALSRVPRLPAMLWQQQQPLALKAHETKVFVFSAQTKLPTNQLVSVSMQAVDPTAPAQPELSFGQRLVPSPHSAIVAMNIATAKPKP